MKTTVVLLLGLCCAFAVGCGDDDGADDDSTVDAGARTDAGIPAGACDESTHVGGFVVDLRPQGFTAVEGRMRDAVTPQSISEVKDTEGACRFVAPPLLFCDPPCGAETCGTGGQCVPTPRTVSAGTLTIEGLANPVTIEPNGQQFYTNTGPLDHPGFGEGDSIRLFAAGSDDVAPFGLSVLGVAPLESAATAVALTEDVGTLVQWTPGAADVATMHIDLNIALHGGTPGSIECEVPDTGSFELPVSLTNQLLAQGFSGFPALTLTRRSVDSDTLAQGCVQFEASAKVTFEVEIDGLTSCSTSKDCPEGQECQGDLTCG